MSATAWSQPAYDRIGRVYSRHRRPDPRIARSIRQALGYARTVINVGAGAGSYEPDDREVVAVEPSAVMIRQRRSGSVSVVQACAEALPFPERAFEAAMAILTVHHWPDRVTGFAEMNRVARRRMVLCFDPEIHNQFWLLRDYLPAAADLECSRAPRLDEVVESLGATRVEVVPVPHDCVDGFGWAYWRRPDAYLDPDVRSCISMLAQLDETQLDAGLEQLAEDLSSGRWARRYAHLLERESIDGGFRLVVADS